jgi:hypothetical protein
MSGFSEIEPFSLHFALPLKVPFFRKKNREKHARANPDPNEALDHCKDPSTPGSNQLKFICSRVMRSQQYMAYAVAMRVRGAGNQLQWGKVLPAALRAAWKYPKYDKQPSFPPLLSADIAA